PKLFPEVLVAIAKLLPEERRLFRYFGSLTTPPCSEIVKWVVFQTPVEVSSAQIEAFKRTFTPNARPVQPLYQRSLLE
ncbi:MAG: carbonic anhydrase family protein, partial [Elainellaceae cyanobacterium]